MKININDVDIFVLYDLLVDWHMFTNEELNLITKINGFNLKTFQDLLYVRYGISLEDFILNNLTKEELEELEELK